MCYMNILSSVVVNTNGFGVDEAMFPILDFLLHDCIDT